jgi:acyl-CoA thioesterase
MTTPFSTLLARATDEGDAVELDVPGEWMQGRSVFGGLQAALALRAMRAHVPPQTPLRTLQITFIAPIAGHLRARATVLRAGANAVHVEARLAGIDGALAMLAIGVFGTPRTSAVSIAPVQPVIAAQETVVELAYVQDVMPAFIQHFDARWLRGALPYTGSTERVHVVDVGLRDADDARATEAHVLALADFVPPIGLSFLRAPANGSTLTWMLELLADHFDHHAPRGWRVDCELFAARDGYTNQSVTLWAPDGSPAALSRQSMLVFG